MAEEIPPHPKLGINLRKALELCGICNTEYTLGMVPMGMQNYKYICPACGFVHYGEPEKSEQGIYKCNSCAQDTESFTMLELKPGEPVKSGIGWCVDCIKRLGDTKIALVETEDGQPGVPTGTVYFLEPPELLKGHFEEAEERTAYISQALCRKIGLTKK